MIAKAYAKYFIYWQLINENISYIYIYLLKNEKENPWVINLAQLKSRY